MKMKYQWYKTYKTIRAFRKIYARLKHIARCEISISRAAP